MARVPVRQGPQETLRPLSPAFQSTDVPADAFGAGAARGLQEAGRGLQALGTDLGDEALRLAIERNEAAAREADAEAAEVFRGILHDAENGYFAQRGRNAVDAQAETEQRLRRELDRIAAGLPTDRSRELFRVGVQSRADAAFTDVSRHARTQHDAYVTASMEARVGTAINDAVLAFNNPQRIRESLAVGERQIGQMAEHNGWDAFQTQAALEAFRSSVYGGVVEAMLDNGRTAAAVDYFQEHRDNLTDDDFLRIDGLVRSADLDAQANTLVNDFFASDSAPGAGAPPRPRLPSPGSVDPGDFYVHESEVAAITRGGRRSAGIRGNNPGNLRDSGVVWEGMTGRQDTDAGEFLTFESPQHGIRAMVMSTLFNIIHRGHITPNQLFPVLGPSDDPYHRTGYHTEPEVYAAEAAVRMGIDPDQIIPLEYEPLRDLFLFMIQRENGGNPYSDRIFEEGFQAGLQRDSIEIPEDVALSPALAPRGGDPDYEPPELPQPEVVFSDGTVARREPEPGDLPAERAEEDVPAPRSSDPITRAIEATRGLDPELAERVIAGVRERVNLQATIDRQQRQQAQEAAWRHVLDDGDISSLPVSVRQAIGPEYESSLRSWIANGRRVETDWDRYAELSRLYADHPDAFAQIDLTADRPRLADEQYQQVLGWQRGIAEDGRDNDRRMSFASARSIANQVIRSVLDTSPEPGTEEAVRLARLYTVLERRLSAFRVDQNGEPDAGDVMAITQRLLNEVEVPGTETEVLGVRISDPDTALLFERLPPYAEIPDRHRAEIERDFRRHFGRPAEPHEVEDIYWGGLIDNNGRRPRLVDPLTLD